MDSDGYVTEEYMSSDEEDDPSFNRRRQVRRAPPSVVRQVDRRFSLVCILLILVLCKYFYVFLVRSHGGTYDAPVPDVDDVASIPDPE